MLPIFSEILGWTKIGRGLKINYFTILEVVTSLSWWKKATILYSQVPDRREGRLLIFRNFSSLLGPPAY